MWRNVEKRAEIRSARFSFISLNDQTPSRHSPFKKQLCVQRKQLRRMVQATGGLRSSPI